MPLLPLFSVGYRPMRKARRTGVSELYASLLMLGVTLSFGSVVASMAMGQLNQGTTSASLGTSLTAQSVGRQVALIYVTSASPGSCPAYEGAQEGTVLTVTLLDYGSQPFTPDQILVNGTTYYSNSYQALTPGIPRSYSVTLAPAGSCAHPGGQNLMLTDTGGDEVQFAS